MPTIEEVRGQINAHQLFIQMQLDGYSKWTVCPGCGDLYAYKQGQEKQPIFLEHPENEFGRCQGGYDENVGLDAIEDVPLLTKAFETFDYSLRKRDKWLAEQEEKKADESDTPAEG